MTPKETERCPATHKAIREGKTKILPLGRQVDPLGEEPDLILYNCPYCRSTISKVAK